MKLSPTELKPKAGRLRLSLQLSVLVGILLVGFFLRAYYLGEFKKAPDFSYPQVDASFHDYWARGLATGDWSPPENKSDPGIRVSPYFRPPGYPYFLALIYLIAGPGYLVPRIVQMGLGLANCLLAFFFARKWYGQTVALILVAFMSSYWIFIYFEGEFQAPVLFIFLLLSLFYILGLWAEKMSFPYSLAAGLLLGLSILVRPNILLFIPVVVGWTLWIARGRRNRRRRYRAALGVILGTIIVVAPTTIRNYIVADDFVLISSNGGINLFIGNNEFANGFCAGTIPGLGKFGTCYDYPAIVRNLEKKQGKPLKHSQVSAYFAHQAIRFIQENPLDFLKLLIKKAFLFWSPQEISHNKVVHYEREFSRLLRNIPGNFSFIFSLSTVGILLLLIDLKRKREVKDKSITWIQKRWEISLLILLFIFTYFLSVLPFFIASRYRVPILPFLLLFGAYGIHRVGRFVAVRDFRRAVCWAIAWLGLYLLVQKQPFFRYQPDLAEWHYKRGVAYSYQKETEQAFNEYQEALRIAPDYAQARVNLGVTLSEQGKIEEAIAQYSEAMRIKPDYPEVYCHYGRALEKQGKLNEAISYYSQALQINPDYAEAHSNLGNVLTKQGKLDEAKAHYSQALRIKPYRAIAHYNLGVALVKEGKLDEAIAQYSEALRIKSDDPETHNNLGVALARKGKIEEAIAHYSEALRIKPEYVEAHTNLGNVLARQGKIDEAIRHYSQALRINPEYPEAHNNLGVALTHRGKFDEAIFHFSEALRIKPDFANARDNLKFISRKTDREFQ